MQYNIRHMTASSKVWSTESLAAPHEAIDKASRVRRMFNAIAPRYELINSLFSAGRDRAWRREAVRLSGADAADVVLDVACGTGDFARAFATTGATVVGCDFAHEMLTRAARRGGMNLSWCEADAQNLPFAEGAFSIVSCAFGVRNFQDLGCGLREMRRVLRPGGRAVILEFGKPTGRLFRRCYDFYTNRLMPFGATLISGDRTGAYRYLPRSVASFPTAEEMLKQLKQAGFAECSTIPLTFGAVFVYVAEASPAVDAAFSHEAK